MSSLSNISSLSRENGFSELKPGTIYVRPIKTHNRECNYDKNSFSSDEAQEHVGAEWYPISVKYVEKIIYDSEGFGIVFHGPLPPELLSWTTNSYDNLKIQSNNGKTLLWIADPQKNFRCCQCKVPYETIFRGNEPDGYSPEIISENLNNFSKNTEQCPVSSDSITRDSEVKPFLSQFPNKHSVPFEYQIKSPTCILIILCISLLLDWSIPIVALFIIYLGLSSQEN